jgi:outer membrane protein TolC
VLIVRTTLSLLLLAKLLFADIVKREDIIENTYKIAISSFNKQDELNIALKKLKDYDLYIDSKNALYIVNIPDKKIAKKILERVVKSHYKKAYVIYDLTKKSGGIITSKTKDTNLSTNRASKTEINKYVSKQKTLKLTDNNDNSDNNLTISLKDALLISLNRSHKIQSLKEKVIQQIYKVREKEGVFLPNITLYSTSGYEYYHTRDKKDIKDKYKKGDIQLNLTQNIYAGGKNSAELNREKAKLLSETASFREKVEEESLKVIEAYLDLYFQKQAIEIEEKNFASLQEILKIVETKERNGAATKGDLNNIKSKVENASTALVKARSRYQNSLSFYRYFLGEENGKKFPKDEKFDFKNYTEANVFDIFKDKNAKLLINRYKIDAQSFDYEAKKSAFKPTVDLILTSKAKYSKAEIDPMREDKASAMISINYNLYKGGSDKAKLLSSKSKLRALKHQYRDIVDSTKYNLKQLFENVKSVNESLSHIKEEVEANRKTLKSYWSAFKYGNQDIQALLLAQRALNRSKQDELKEKKNYILGHFKLLSQTGELLEFLGLEDFVNPQTMR